MRRSYISNFHPLNFVLFLCAIHLFQSLLASEIKWECTAIDDYLTSSVCQNNNGTTQVINEPSELGGNWEVTLLFPGGSVFEGTSIDGIIFGKRTDPNGDIFEGPILGKYFHGKVQTLSSDGTMRESIFIEGEEQNLVTSTIKELPEYWRCLNVDLDGSDQISCVNGSDKEKIIPFGSNLDLQKEFGTNWDLKIVNSDDEVLEVTSRNGSMFGKTTLPDGKITQGQIITNEYNGKGKILYPNGDQYIGELLDGERHGKGKLLLKNGGITEGDWEQGGISQGKQLFIDEQGASETYKGSFDPETGAIHGQGSIKFSNGETYEGNFIQGFLHGYGVYKWKNAIYKGYFVNGTKDGYGEYSSDEPFDAGAYKYDRYNGEFKNDLFNGVGALFLGNKIIYIGNFVDDLRGGYGILASGVSGIFGEDGDRGFIKGQWKNSVHGIGSKVYADGSSYEGLYKNGDRHGMGKLNYPSEKKSQVGYFVDGELEGPAIEIFNGIKIDVNFVNGSKQGKAQITWADDTQSIAIYKNDQFVDGSIETDKSFNLLQSKRLALVIGNDNYLSGPLENAVSDSIGVKNALEDVGFQVIHSPNLDQESFLQAIWTFKRKLKSMGPSTTALFYYSGHALEVDGTNYLNPTDGVIESKFDLETQSINVSRVFSALEAASSGVKIMILDACRNNPFVSFNRSPSQGLAQMNAPTGTIISYSTAPGKLALDGMVNGYSMYTGSLIQSIGLPGLTIEEAFKRTRQSVVKLSDSKQIPWESSSLLGDFYFLKE